MELFGKGVDNWEVKNQCLNIIALKVFVKMSRRNFWWVVEVFFNLGIWFYMVFDLGKWNEPYVDYFVDIMTLDVVYGDLCVLK